MRYLHGTSSGYAESILKEGFRLPIYFTIDMEDAEYYAATGGESALQKREEQYKRETGVSARKHFYPDMWDMYQALYPKGQHPVVLEIELPENIASKLKSDSGAIGGMVADFLISQEHIVFVHRVQWVGFVNETPVTRPRDAILDRKA